MDKPEVTEYRKAQERVRHLQAALVDAEIPRGARPLTDAEVAEYMSGAPFIRFAFVGVRFGVLYGREA